jgi:hypothetical protein
MSRLKQIKLGHLASVSIFCLIFICTGSANPQSECPDSTVTDNVNWPIGNLPNEQIEPGTCITLSIPHGCSPINWSVDGDGFYFDGDTQGMNAKLCLDESACGSATIMVDDACGRITEEAVRSWNGTWVEIDAGCPIPGPPNRPDAGGWKIRIQGKYRVKQEFIWTAFRRCGGCPEEGEEGCQKHCSDWSYCTNTCDSDSAMGCAECITWDPKDHHEYAEFPCAAWSQCEDGKYLNLDCYLSKLGLSVWQCP